MITVETCRTCKGKGIMERLEERDHNGDWHHNIMLDASLADAWIKADRNAPLRWADVKCPGCYGEKQVIIEHVKCKIF